MNKCICILLALYVLNGCTSKADRTMGEINLLLDSLQIQYAPDIRVALWDLTLSEADGELVLSGGLETEPFVLQQEPILLLAGSVKLSPLTKSAWKCWSRRKH